MSTAIAEAIANAVLYEGYVLYPYRASAPKNRMRWQIGLVTPRSFAEAAGSDPWFTQTECLVDAGARARLTVRVRALHLQERTIEDASTSRPVGGIEVDGQRLVAWEEAVVAELTCPPFALNALPSTWVEPWTLDSYLGEEIIRDGAGRVAARVRRRRREIRAAIQFAIEQCGHLVRVRIRVENHSPTDARTLDARDSAVRQSMAGTHVILAIEDGAFVSLLEPSPRDAPLAASCLNQHTFPVRVGPPGSSGVMLSSPIVLYDYPAIAKESGGDFFDATEIDELLTLRVHTMTDEEKREARATDERAARIIDRCDAITADSMAELHGAVRNFGDDRGLRPGDRVRLAPSRRADAIDICLRGRLATVASVYRTLEGVPYIAVVPDDDPFGAAGERYRRSLFFHPDELVPLSPAAGGGGS